MDTRPADRGVYDGGGNGVKRLRSIIAPVLIALGVFLIVKMVDECKGYEL